MKTTWLLISKIMADTWASLKVGLDPCWRIA